MIPSGYEGPRDGDYVAYVDQLLRASPDFRRTQSSLAGALESAAATPGEQGAAPMGQLRAKLQQVREIAEQAERSKAPAPGRTVPRAQASPGQVVGKEEARQRLRAIEREIESQKAKAEPKRQPWISPLALVLIVAGFVISRFVPGFGAVLTVMGFMSLIGGVLSRLKGR